MVCAGPEIAGCRESGAAADAVFLDGADRHLLDALPGIAKLRPDADHVPALEQAIGPVAAHRWILEVRACGERTFAGNDDGVGLEIVRETLRRLGELEDDLSAHGVVAVAAVEGDGRNRAIADDADEFADFRLGHWRTLLMSAYRASAERA